MSEINDIEVIPEGNFPINLKLIVKYQRMKPRLMDKYKDYTYHKDYLCGGSTVYLNLIRCEDSIFFPSFLQKNILYWYHTYLLHSWIDRTEAIIHQHLYWPGIIKAVWKEVTSFDTWQRTKLSNIKYDKSTAKEAEEIPRNNLCVDIFGPYTIQIKRREIIFKS